MKYSTPPSPKKREEHFIRLQEFKFHPNQTFHGNNI